VILLYLLTLPALLHVENGLWRIGSSAIGGGLFFGLGLLLPLPRPVAGVAQKIKHREGVFRILNWR